MSIAKAITGLLSLALVAQAQPAITHAGTHSAVSTHCSKTHEYLVHLDSNTAESNLRTASGLPTPRSLRAHLHSDGAQRKSSDKQANVVAYCFGADEVESSLAVLQKMPGVKHIEQNSELHLLASTNQWNLDRVDQAGPALDGVFEQKSTGTGVHVYICDTGTAVHPDYSDRLVPGWSAFEHLGEPWSLDQHGHGTHCTGTAAGTRFGVANNATVVGVKVFQTGSASMDSLVGSLNFAIEHKTAHGGPAVFSMSLGSKRGQDNTVGDTVIQSAIAAGIVVSVAGGNDGINACKFWPAGSHGVLTVGATGHGMLPSGEAVDYVAPFSNWGNCTDVYAPGMAIVSAKPDGTNATMQGTSMACPLVSGVVATILQRNPELTHAEVIAELKRTALDIKTPYMVGTGEPQGNMHLMVQVHKAGGTCSDSVQNGMETGVDCGGDCEPCDYCAAHCPAKFVGDDRCDVVCNVAACGNDAGDCSSTCADGLRNGDEMAIDCGGSCDACPAECAEGCNKDWISDGNCDAACDVAACGFDSTDGDRQTGDCRTRCDDGLLNGDEVKQDCGGSCEACGESCPFTNHSGIDNVYICHDGTHCNSTEVGWGCCANRGNRAQCPLASPVMCADPAQCGGGTSHCCAPTAAGCAAGIRVCSAASDLIAPVPYMGTMGGECPLAQTITELSACEMAIAKYANLTQPMWEGDYELIPAGCSYRAPNGKLSQGHFNKHASGHGHAHRAPVCTLNFSPYVVGEMGSDCAEGALIESDAECLEAMKALKVDPEPMWTGNFNKMTAGCSYRTDGKAFAGHYNAARGGQASTFRAPICHKYNSH